MGFSIFAFSAVLVKMFWTVLLALIGATSAAVICSDYQAGGGGGAGDYYVRPIPGNCRARHLGNWRPRFRIRGGQAQCRGGWRKYRGKCYYDRRRHGHCNFRDCENWCNQHQAHIYIHNDRQEYLWVEQNVMRHNEWYWVGIFCSGGHGRTTDLNKFYTPSGEDMRQIQQKIRCRMHPGHWIDHGHDRCCAISHKNNNTWRWMWHHQQGNEGRASVCEAPSG